MNQKSYLNNLPFETINKLFDERKNYIVVALTGKVGSGIDEVPTIFKKSVNDVDFPCPQPGDKGLLDDEEREARILYRYYHEQQQEFFVISVRDVITSFLLEVKDWSSVFTTLSQSQAKDIEKNVWEYFKKEYGDSLTEKDAFFNKKNTYREYFEKKNSKFIEEHKNKKNYSIATFKYITKDLQKLTACIRKVLNKNYTVAYQALGNELRFFGTLDKNERNYSSEPEKNNIFTISSRVNWFIKTIQYREGNSEKKPTLVVIDSMKNIYESNYLKDRYSAYYLMSVTRDEDFRINQLLLDETKQYTRDDISTIDYNERPGISSKKIVKFAKHLYDYINKNEDNNDRLKEYLAEISDSKNLYMGLWEKFIVAKHVSLKELKKSAKKEVLNIWNENNENNIFKENGISRDLCIYYCDILDDPLRIFLYLKKLHSFYLQDAETCIQNADIFITNNEKSQEPKVRLTKNVIRYIALMMHPGLVLPTPIERCMQIAYAAKVNSGCISRQVGAVVTDKEYNILSLGWNDVPYGQTPCIYRNLYDLFKNRDKLAYSDYEWEKDGDLNSYLKKIDFSKAHMENALKGLPLAYCFKSLNEDVTGSKNPMEARSMHGEEKALLVADKTKTKGGYLFTTSSPCHMCAKNAKQHQIKKIYYIEPYPGISQSHVCNSGKLDNRAQFELFEGAIGRAYNQLYTPIIPLKDELGLRGAYKKKYKS